MFRYFPIAVVGLATAILLQWSIVIARERIGLDVSAGTLVAISECSQSIPQQILAGGMGTLHVIVYDETSGSAATDSRDSDCKWPSGLTIEAGTVSRSGCSIVAGLVDRLHFRRWHFQAEPSKPRSRPLTGGRQLEKPRDSSWRFTFEVPEDLVGQHLFFCAMYVHPPSDTLVSPICGSTADEVDQRSRITVVEPCSPKDCDRATGAAVFYANLGGDHARAVALADSLIPLGWRDLAGLEAAAQSAEWLGLPQKSLKYVDLNFSANGRISSLGGAGRYFDQGGTPADTEDYARKRQRLQIPIGERQPRY
jgi:hypothetical protein